MTEDEFFATIDPVLRELGAVPREGEEYRSPPLDVLRYHTRGVKMHWFPVLGRALGVVAVVRQPADLGTSAGDVRKLLQRLGQAASTRFPAVTLRGADRQAPGGLALGLAAVVLTPEPIGPGDEAVLAGVIGGKAPPRQRSVPMGLLRVNLGQEALAFALATGPDGLFPEALALADALTPCLRRFVPLMEGDF